MTATTKPKSKRRAAFAGLPFMGPKSEKENDSRAALLPELQMSPAEAWVIKAAKAYVDVLDRGDCKSADALAAERQFIAAVHGLRRAEEDE